MCTIRLLTPDYFIKSILAFNLRVGFVSTLVVSLFGHYLQVLICYLLNLPASPMSHRGDATTEGFYEG